MMINKVRTNKKYPFKQMSTGETFKLNNVNVRDAQRPPTTTAVCVSAPLVLLSLNRMTAIIVAALLK